MSAEEKREGAALFHEHGIDEAGDIWL
ncbi:protein of unknown function [Methylorubrum extorquens]|uniref:Uncharacterized protein n=1 Tax=Methylorubrum extorquens TaxID=408 RepID=A0A2N9AVW1_METEX|nr:protein of unknown function [Methylorubrum extorquens]